MVGVLVDQLHLLFSYEEDQEEGHGQNDDHDAEDGVFSRTALSSTEMSILPDDIRRLRCLAEF